MLATKLGISLPSHWSCIFSSGDFVRHFPGLAFSSPANWSVIFAGPALSRSCIFSRPVSVYTSYYIIDNNCFAGFVATNITINITIPTLSDPVPVKSVFGWIMIHQHLYLGDIWYWNRPWAAYKAGFGSIDANFWLGLEKMHLLTSSRPYRLRVEVQKASTNLWYSAEYWSFKIGDEPNDKYRLEVSGYGGDAGDELQYEGNGGRFYHNGMHFSTYDNDNDEISNYNIAQQYIGGWWYNEHPRVLLTGYNNAHKWGDLSLLSKSRMMIKPN